MAGRCGCASPIAAAPLADDCCLPLPPTLLLLPHSLLFNCCLLQSSFLLLISQLLIVAAVAFYPTANFFVTSCSLLSLKLMLQLLPSFLEVVASAMSPTADC